MEAAAGDTIHSAVVPIGVEAREVPVIPFNVNAHRLLSVATMHYPPNAEAIRWFARDMWPILRSEHPDLEVDIVGSRPPRDIIDLGKLDQGMCVHGFVEDVEHLYRQAAVFIVPLQTGSGVRVKILEAMARGIPVVSTTVGADGLDVRHGVHLLIADTPHDFARSVTLLLEQPELRSRVARAARQRTLALYDWRQCCRPLLEAYQDLATISRTDARGGGSPFSLH
ncbi:MAG TPA: glycosyltransferase family 4 protein [Thermomicrobiales bacterium]|nr:glycosyltransferase family 4 protein [Thermomicrobiales bacterium]